MRFHVLMAASMKIASWDIASIIRVMNIHNPDDGGSVHL
jgi:hypothetical protein